MERFEIRNEHVVYRCSCCDGSGQTEGPKVHFVDQETFETFQRFQKNWKDAEAQSYDDWAKQRGYSWIRRNDGYQGLVTHLVIICLMFGIVIYALRKEGIISGSIVVRPDITTTFLVIGIIGSLAIAGTLDHWRTVGPKRQWRHHQWTQAGQYLTVLQVHGVDIDLSGRAVLCTSEEDLFTHYKLGGTRPLSENTVVVMAQGEVITPDGEAPQI